MDERQKLLGVLEELSDKELKKFVFFLPDAIPGGKRDTDSRVDLAKLILRYYPERALDVLVDVLHRVPRKDLVLQLQGEAKARGPHRDGTEEEREAAAAAGKHKGGQAAADLSSVETQSCCPQPHAGLSGVTGHLPVARITSARLPIEQIANTAK